MKAKDKMQIHACIWTYYDHKQGKKEELENLLLESNSKKH